MLIVLSPAKTLDLAPQDLVADFSQADFLPDAAQLVDELRRLAPHQLASLMSISDQLAGLNYDRLQAWSRPFTPENAKQAVLAFRGDVYQGLDADSFDVGDFAFAQVHLRILSGLYGVLRPLDLIQPYRLEMGTRLVNARGGNLYQFWGDAIALALRAALAAVEAPVLINLASNEYFKAVRMPALQAAVITPVFKERRAGQYRIISFAAKRARGRMAAYIIRRRLLEPESIKQFDEDGYRYNPGLSGPSQWVFTRHAP